ncbi:MAG: FHA domain-containing protein [Chloroflexota bacterium]
MPYIGLPPAGQRTARLVLTLSDGSVVNSDLVSFTSNQDFIRPPEISIKGQVQPIGNSLTFGLIITSPDLIEKLTIAVISKKTGDAVLTQDVELTETETYKVAADILKAGDEYTLVVSAVDDKGRTLAQTAAEFKFEPPQTSIEITQVEPTEDKSAFVVQVDSSELEGVVKYKVFLVSSQAGSTPVPGTAQTIIVGDPISIPVRNPESGAYLESGTYKVVVQALDSENKVLAQISSEDISFERPSAFELAIKWISERPLAIVGISLACFVAFVGLIAVVWMLLPKPSSKPKTVELVLPEKMRRPAPVDDASMFEPPRRPAERPPQPERPARRPEPAEAERRPSARPAPPSAEVRPAARPSPAESQVRPVQYPAPPAPEAKPGLPKACLKGQEPANIRSSTEITKSPFTIGRRDDNDLVVKVDNTMGVSGHHATITFTNNRFYIKDDKSTYGVLINGQKIQPTTPVPLEDGMIIGLGPKVKLQFHLTNCP